MPPSQDQELIDQRLYVLDGPMPDPRKAFSPDSIAAMRTKMEKMGDSDEKQKLAKQIADAQTDAQAYKDDWIELEAPPTPERPAGDFFEARGRSREVAGCFL